MVCFGLFCFGVFFYLFIFNCDYGVGYELVNDCVCLLVFEGFDLFVYVELVKEFKLEKL